LPIPDPVDRYEDFVPVYVPPQPRPRRLWLHWLLFLLTLASTTFVGAEMFAYYEVDVATLLAMAPADRQQWATDLFGRPSFYFNGFWYSLTILTILGCHEMGHYLACLRYRVDVTLPFFLPAPITLTGTLGAFIRIRSRIPGKIALFDIGIAGPIAGFVIAVPALFAGLWMSKVVPIPEDSSGLLELGEPLLFQFAAWTIWGDVPAGQTISMHPMAFAAWFGLLATALNLFPISQLDGGHISYAVLGRRSTWVTLATMVVVVALALFSLSWVVWAILLGVMIFVLGPHHPPTLDEDEPLDQGRLILAGVALLMLVVCFTPAPIGEFIGSP
jgi:membrane-associated protease RseP (regulator of RpoE activity)